jgi:hypothetical protein
MPELRVRPAKLASGGGVFPGLYDAEFVVNEQVVEAFHDLTRAQVVQIAAQQDAKIVEALPGEERR